MIGDHGGIQCLAASRRARPAIDAETRMQRGADLGAVSVIFDGRCRPFRVRDHCAVALDECHAPPSRFRVATHTQHEVAGRVSEVVGGKVLEHRSLHLERALQARSEVAPVLPQHERPRHPEAQEDEQGVRRVELPEEARTEHGAGSWVEVEPGSGSKPRPRGLVPAQSTHLYPTPRTVPMMSCSGPNFFRIALTWTSMLRSRMIVSPSVSRSTSSSRV